jgi:energy-coupling factor transporter ATP-binding protein EcfA2
MIMQLFLIKQTLGFLEVEVCAAASALGLPNWKIAFTTESETKSGTTKMAVQIIVTDAANGSELIWSGGEEQRIRLAVALGMSNLIQRMSNTFYDLEVWDEPTNFLSNEGIEGLLSCLQYRSVQQGKGVWLIDHRALVFSGFSQVWTMTKTIEGSSMQLTSRED